MNRKAIQSATGWLLLALILSATITPAITPAMADDGGFFGKLKLVFNYLRDPGLIISYIKNEFINPILHKDPYSRYKNIIKSGSGSTSEPTYMKEVREKLNSYFAKINGYKLTDEQLQAIGGMRDVTLTIMDGKHTYYLKHIYVSGSTVRLDGKATKNMVSITPKAAYELTYMLDNYLKDGTFSNAELKSLGNWGLSKYKSGDISGKRSHIEAALNFLLSDGSSSVSSSSTEGSTEGGGEA